MPNQKNTIALTITANHRRLRGDLRRASGEVKAFERNVSGTMNRIKMMRQRIMSTGILGRGGGALRTAAGFAGIFGFQQLISEAKDADARLTDIGITGNLTRSQMKALREEMFRVSKNTALSTNSVLDFVDAVTVQTGNTQSARDALKDIGEVAVATGANMDDLGGVFVKLTANLKLLPSQAKEAFNVLRAQEKMGSVTLANVAGNFGKLVGAAQPFGKAGQGIRGVQALGGLFQLTARGFGIGQETEAATASESFLRFLGQRGKQIEKTFGVKTTDAQGNFRDLPTLFRELGEAFNRNQKAFREKGALIFGRAGIRTARQLAAAAAGPGGWEKTQGKFSAASSLFSAGGVDVIAQDAAKRRASNAYKFNKAMNEMKIQLQKMAIEILPKLTKALPTLVKALKFMLDNSRQLFQLWLGYKGMKFFAQLMAPMQGGGPAGAAMAMQRGMAGGGMLMGPGGMMMGPGVLGRSGYRKGYVYHRSMESQGFMSAQNRRYSDAQMLRRERRFGRTRRFGRAFGRGAIKAGGAGLQMLPAVPMGIGIGELIANKIVGGDWRNPEYLKQMSADAQVKMDQMRRRFAASTGGMRRQIARQDIAKYMGGTAGGARLKMGIKKTLGSIGTADAAGFVYDQSKVFSGRDPEKRATRILGSLKAQRSAVMQRAVANLRKQGLEVNKANLYQVAPILSTLDGTIQQIDSTLAKLISGEKITVNAIVRIPKGASPADRLVGNYVPPSVDLGGTSKPTGVSVAQGVFSAAAGTVKR